ncbi:MAG TPA: GDSL-type esterase/lipase family protein [Stellaceae bacterium]|nr:GDSL-type esterase/lipase family protein [Stellaceae bacterium]
MFALTPGRAVIGANADARFQLKCRPFTNVVLPTARQQTDPEAVERFRQIIQEVRSGSHNILFLGDSLTRKWDPAIWNRDFAPRGALNAGVNGDRTEHLLWRLDHGDLDGQHPQAVVLLIGTNDIGRNRPPEVIAEGIRDILGLLRSRLPAARILLLGVLPRNESPFSRRRDQVREVNRRIRMCADNEHIFYDNVGKVLLDRTGRLTRTISPDGVHLSKDGYFLLTARLELALRPILTSGQSLPGRQTQTR